MTTVESLRKRAEKLVEQNGGNVVLIYRDEQDYEAKAEAEQARGNIPLILDAEDRGL